MQVVGCAVQRIDHPRAPAAGASELLAHHGDVGGALAENLPDGPFGGPVHFGHVVASPLGLSHGGRPLPGHERTAMHGGPLGELQEIGQGGHGAKLAGPSGRQDRPPSSRFVDGPLSCL